MIMDGFGTIIFHLPKKKLVRRLEGQKQSSMRRTLVAKFKAKPKARKFCTPIRRPRK